MPTSAHADPLTDTSDRLAGQPNFAASWARGIAAGRVPGYRARRDAYCARKVRG